MPHRFTEEFRFVRRNGAYTLTMTAMQQGTGLPYGAMARHLMVWIVTEALRTGSRELVLGETLTEFLRKLGHGKQGGPRSPASRVKNQTERLLACGVAASYRTDARAQREQFTLVDRSDLWWTPEVDRDRERDHLWCSTLTLSERFYGEIRDHGVPVDLRVIQDPSIRQSPLALDVYAWLTHRMYTLRAPTVRAPGSDQAEVRRWTAAEVDAAVPWLKRWNAQGREVLVRPAPGEDAGLVRVGGLSAEGIAAMTATGREPAVVVETSPGRLEVWVRVPACDGAHRAEIARGLGSECGADPEGASPEDARPEGYGRLAGFTTGAAGGARPWVLCRASSGQAASAGPVLVAAAGQRLGVRAQKAQAQQLATAERFRGPDRGRGGEMER